VVCLRSLDDQVVVEAFYVCVIAFQLLNTLIAVINRLVSLLQQQRQPSQLSIGALVGHLQIEDLFLLQRQHAMETIDLLMQ
jgi:hypothetical protein